MVHASFLWLIFGVRATTAQTIEESELLQLQAIVDFFSCDCPGNPTVTTSSWCHCSNPYILPRKLEIEPTNSFSEQYCNYSQQYTCASDGEGGDTKCQLFRSFEPLERHLNIDNEQVVQQQLVLSKPATMGLPPSGDDTGPDVAIGELWTQQSLNGTLSPPSAVIGDDLETDGWVLPSVSKEYLNTWWLRNQSSSGSPTEVAVEIAVIKATSVVNSASGTDCVLLTLFTGQANASSRADNPLQGLRKTDEVVLPGLAVGGAGAFALADQLPYFEPLVPRNEHDIGNEDNDQQSVVGVDRVFLVPVQIAPTNASDESVPRIDNETQAVLTDGIAFIRVLWGWGTVDSLTATFDRDVVFWGAEQLELGISSTVGGNADCEIVDVAPTVHFWGCDISTSGGSSTVTANSLSESANGPGVLTDSTTTTPSLESVFDDLADVIANQSSKDMDTFASSSDQLGVDDLASSLDLVALMQGYNPTTICSHSHRLLAIASSSRVNIFEFQWPTPKTDPNASSALLSTKCSLAEVSRCPTSPRATVNTADTAFAVSESQELIQTDGSAFTFWFLTNPSTNAVGPVPMQAQCSLPLDSLTSVVVEDSAGLSHDNTGVSSNVNASDQEYGIATVDLLTSKVASTISLDETVSFESVFAEGVWIVVGANPGKSHDAVDGNGPSAFVSTVQVPGFSTMDANLSKPNMWNPYALSAPASAPVPAPAPDPLRPSSLWSPSPLPANSVIGDANVVDASWSATAANLSSISTVAIPPTFTDRPADATLSASSVSSTSVPVVVPRIRSIVARWRSFSLNLDTQYEEVCNVTQEEIESIRALGSASDCNDAVMESLDLSSWDSTSDLNTTADDGGLSDLLSGQYGSRYVIFVTDTVDRIHVLHASSLKAMVVDLRQQIQTTLSSGSSTHNSSTDASDSSDLADAMSALGEAINTNATPTQDTSGATEGALSTRASTMLLELVNVVNVGNEIAGIDVTENAQYAFVSNYQPKSTLKAMERSVEICAELGQDRTTGDAMSNWYGEAERLALGAGVPEFSNGQCTAGAATGDANFGGSGACARTADELLRVPAQGDFVSVLTACETSAFCPTFSEESVSVPLPAGTFSRFGFDADTCPQGCYCQSATRVPCDLGFVCPDEGLSWPQRCQHDPTRSETCYESGLTAPVPCADGTLCGAPYAPAMPAAPGYMQTVFFSDNSSAMSNGTDDTTSVAGAMGDGVITVLAATDPDMTAVLGDALLATVAPIGPQKPVLTTASATNRISSTVPASSFSSEGVRVLVPCPDGYYCNTGRSETEPVADLLCPASTYCASAAVLEPTICDQGGNCTSEQCPLMSACPAGSTEELLCPAGFYCTSPEGDPTSVMECNLGSYCPAGSVLWAICPAGFYCPDPTERLMCEEGYYCPEGSVTMIECNLFEVCEAGSATAQIFFSVLVLCGLPILIMGLCFAAQACLLKCRAQRHASRLQAAILEAQQSLPHSPMAFTAMAAAPCRAASTLAAPNITGCTSETDSGEVAKVEEVILSTNEENRPTGSQGGSSQTRMQRQDSDEQILNTSNSTVLETAELSQVSSPVSTPIRVRSEPTLMPPREENCQEHLHATATEQVGQPVDTALVDFSRSGMSPHNTLAQLQHRARVHSITQQRQNRRRARRRLRSTTSWSPSRSRSRSRSGEPSERDYEQYGESYSSDDGLGSFDAVDSSCERLSSASRHSKPDELDGSGLYGEGVSVSQLGPRAQASSDSPLPAARDGCDAGAAPTDTPFSPLARSQFHDGERSFGEFGETGVALEVLREDDEDDVDSDPGSAEENEDLAHELSVFARAGLQPRGEGHTVDLVLQSLTISKAGGNPARPGPTPSAQTEFLSNTRERVKLLHDVSGHIRHGELTAVMGPSGSGKTLLLQALAGKVPPDTLHVTGELTVNGCPVPADLGLSLLGGHTGYVPKDDTMMRTLTVKENLIFSARSRKTPSAQDDEQDYIALVDGVIDILGLYNIRHNTIGDENTRGISGGQRKRVNIGIELVAEPTVLLLDEPTSGLDATCASEVCAAMKALAKLGLTVVSVIHQPRYEIYRIFDSLVLLQSNGHCAYFGECRRAELFFERTYGWDCPANLNPADFLMDAIKRVDDLREKNVELVASNGDGTATLRFTGDATRTRIDGRSNNKIQQVKFGAEENAEVQGNEVVPTISAVTTDTKNGSDSLERRLTVVEEFDEEELQRQLQARNLRATGRKRILQRRLCQAIKDEWGEGGVEHANVIEERSLGDRPGGFESFGAISQLSGEQSPSNDVHHSQRHNVVFAPERRVDAIAQLARQLPPARRSSSGLLLLWLCFWRSLIQQSRSKSGWVIDNLLVLLCALFLGLLYLQVDGEDCTDCEWMSAGEPEQAFIGCSDAVAAKYQPLLVQIGDQVLLRGTMCMIAMGITSATSAMRVFQSERKEYFRENSRLPKLKHTVVYMVGKDLAFLHQWIVGPLVFVLVFHSITTPRCSVWEMYLPLCAAYYVGAGLSYVICLVASRSVAQELVVVLVFGFAMFAGGNMRLPQLTDKVPPLCYLHHISFLRYVLEAYYVAEANEWAADIELMGTNYTEFLANAYSYTSDSYAFNVGIAFAWGLLFRLVALVVMAAANRNEKL